MNATSEKIRMARPDAIDVSFKGNEIIGHNSEPEPIIVAEKEKLEIWKTIYKQSRADGRAGDSDDQENKKMTCETGENIQVFIHYQGMHKTSLFNVRAGLTAQQLERDIMAMAKLPSETRPITMTIAGRAITRSSNFVLHPFDTIKIVSDHLVGGSNKTPLLGKVNRQVLEAEDNRTSGEQYESPRLLDELFTDADTAVERALPTILQALRKSSISKA